MTTNCIYGGALRQRQGVGLVPLQASDTSTLDFEFSTSTCYDGVSTSPAYVNGFSYGEIVMSVLAFIILILIAQLYFWQFLRGWRVRA